LDVLDNDVVFKFDKQRKTTNSMAFQLGYNILKLFYSTEGTPFYYDLSRIYKSILHSDYVLHIGNLWVPVPIELLTIYEYALADVKFTKGVYCSSKYTDHYYVDQPEHVDSVELHSNEFLFDYYTNIQQNVDVEVRYTGPEYGYCLFGQLPGGGNILGMFVEGFYIHPRDGNKISIPLVGNKDRIHPLHHTLTTTKYFLFGLARFMNHACDIHATCILTSGHNDVAIVQQKLSFPDRELTINYNSLFTNNEESVNSILVDPDDEVKHESDTQTRICQNKLTCRKCVIVNVEVEEEEQDDDDDDDDENEDEVNEDEEEDEEENDEDEEEDDNLQNDEEDEEDSEKDYENDEDDEEDEKKAKRKTIRSRRC